ncbi:class I SAM-dependent methyltransferase [Pseudoroseomonas wenyumeiae]
MNVSTPSSPPDFTALKQRQQANWASGDYAVIGVTLQIVGEQLCEAVDLRSGERVLDVAGGNGNASLAAARRFAEVTCTDYVPALLERARLRAEADHLPMQVQTADAEALPFPDASFDVVLSTFGVMFTPDQEKAAAEMARVCRPGGRIGLANWTPGSFVGRLFQLLGRFLPPPAGVRSPALWGTEERLNGSSPAPPSPAPRGASTSATARRSIGSRSSAPTTARSTRPSWPWMPRSRRHWRKASAS